MSVVIGLKFSSRWRHPVHVGNDDRITGAVVGPNDALRFMQSKFMFRSGSTYRLAQQSCRQALAGKTDPESARRHFMDAYAEDCVRRCLLAEANGISIETINN